jgi:hypothetical protein
MCLYVYVYMKHVHVICVCMLCMYVCADYYWLRGSVVMWLTTYVHLYVTHIQPATEHVYTTINNTQVFGLMLSGQLRALDQPQPQARTKRTLMES